MSKYYFINEDGENCYNKQYLKLYMKENNLNEIEVFKAKMTTGTEAFYCAEFDFSSDKDNSDCGNECQSYKPRNGKNGRCKFSRNCYEPSEKILIKL